MRRMPVITIFSSAAVSFLEAENGGEGGGSVLFFADGLLPAHHRCLNHFLFGAKTPLISVHLPLPLFEEFVFE